MLEIEIKDNKKNLNKIQFPSAIEEISFPRFIEYSTNAINTTQWLLEKLDSDELEDNMAEYIYRLTSMLSEFLDQDMNTIFHLPLGDEKEHVEDLVQLINKKNINLGSAKDSLYRLYAFLFNLIQAYRPAEVEGDYKFTHNGQDYYVPMFCRDLVTGNLKLGKLVTGQAIEAYEIDRQYQMLNKQAEYKDKAGLNFNRSIRLIALFVRKEGVDFPKSPILVEDYLNEMCLELQDINMRIGVDILFFLGNTMSLSEQLESITTLLTLLKGKTSMRKPLRSGKKKIKRRGTGQAGG